MKFEERVAADKQALKDREEEFQTLLELSHFFSRHPELVECDSAVAVVRNYLGDAEITPENLEAAYQHTALNQQLPKQTPQEDRAKIEAGILELMKGGTSADGLASVQAGFRFKSLEQLRQKRRELEARASLRSKTPQELKAIVQTARPSSAQELPADISRKEILHVWDAATIRHWAARVGMAAITKRINEGRR